jgi:hypothetical protein
MKCVFDAGMNEEQTVVVFASGNTHLYVLRLRELQILAKFNNKETFVMYSEC